MIATIKSLPTSGFALSSNTGWIARKWVGLLAIAVLASCDVVNPEEGIPAYLNVPEVQLETNSITEGSDSEKITDVWLNLDGDFLGAYPLPAMIPVLETGDNREITLQFGIKDNGINSTPEIYPFYESLTFTATLSPNVVDTIRPTVNYLENAQFAFIESFERSAHLFQDIVGRGNADQIQLVPGDAFEGNQSLRIRLDSSSSIVEVATNERFGGLTAQSPLVYLEINYRSDVPVIFGVIGHELNGLASQGAPALDPGFSPREDWNKIYFNLSVMIAQINREEYQIVLQAFIPIENGQLSRESADVWLDNIKLVHF